VPSLYDISDSAHWGNRCDVGVVVHRDDEGATSIRIAKSRYHDQIGVPGEATAYFHPAQSMFKSYEPQGALNYGR
jgi:twinkle protein